MISFLSWYLLITFLGWVSLPLTFHLFPDPAVSNKAFVST